MRSLDKFSAYTASLNDSEISQLVIMMIKNASLTAETQNIFVIQLSTSVFNGDEKKISTVSAPMPQIGAFRDEMVNDKVVYNHPFVLRFLYMISN